MTDFDLSQIDQATVSISSKDRKVVLGGTINKNSPSFAHHAALAQVDLEQELVDFAKTFGANSIVSAVAYGSTQDLGQQAKITLLLNSGNEKPQGSSQILVVDQTGQPVTEPIQVPAPAFSNMVRPSVSLTLLPGGQGVYAYS